MDQSIVAGAGLIYANEPLFRAGLQPQKLILRFAEPRPFVAVAR